MPEMTSAPLAVHLQADCSSSVLEVLLLKSKNVLTWQLLCGFDVLTFVLLHLDTGHASSVLGVQLVVLINYQTVCLLVKYYLLEKQPS